MQRLVAIGVVLFGTGLLAADGLDPALAARGWSEVRFADLPGNQFRLEPGGTIAVISERSVSLLGKAVSVDLGATPILTWRWRVERAVPATDLAAKGSDDRSLAVYVTFPYEPEKASMVERLQRTMVELIAGSDAAGRVLTYVWGGIGAPGTVVASPHLGSAGRLTILRPASTAAGVWLSERVDLVADYRATFGSDPPDPIQLAIGADSDDTGTSAMAEVGDFAFRPR